MRPGATRSGAGGRRTVQALGLGLLAASLLTPGSAGAQALTGRVFDGASGLAVPDVEVAVLDTTATPVGLAVSDSAGAFHIPLETAGTYRLAATAVGYDSLAVDSIAVGEAEDVWVELRLGPRPFDVEELTVIARRPMGPPAVREFYRRLDRHERFGSSGVVLDREALDRHIGETATAVLVRESIYAREVYTFNGGLVIRPRGARLNPSPWCTPAFFLDGLRADGATIRSIPASDLMGLEMYRSVTEIPAQFLSAPGASRCGVVLAWTRRGGGRPLMGELRPVRVGVFASGGAGGGPTGLDAIGLELERGVARSLVGWIEVGLTRSRFDRLCVPYLVGSCGAGDAPWMVLVGATLFPTETELPIAPFVGGGVGLASPESGIEISRVLRIGLELVPGPAHVRVELRNDPNGWGIGVGVMF